MGSYRGGYIYRQDRGLVEQNAAIMAARPEPDRPKYARNSAPCGTPAAYRRHLRRGEKPCQACEAADRRRQAERRALGRRR